MTQWVLSVDAADDLNQLVDFLLDKFPHEAAATADLIVDALNILAQHPKIGRPVEQGLRELVISRGKSGYLALYQYDEAADMAVVLAVRHQREKGYH
jgi:plasmid stabilization system protein ParE